MSDLIDWILKFNANYSIQRDAPRNFRHEGEKDRVRAELRVFNGMPQLVVFYGKQRYTFNIVRREREEKVKALLRIMGFIGIDAIPREILSKHFTEGEIQLRKASLKQSGV